MKQKPSPRDSTSPKLKIFVIRVGKSLQIEYNVNILSMNGEQFMAKTIQVRVDDELKDSADALFASLGLDTSTAIRMFLVASMENGGIPFSVKHNADRDSDIWASIARRRAGVPFLSAEQSLGNMRAAIKAGAESL
jgi:DNA-damage-inducible protein J